ncbi:MAG: hypothetical protein AB7I27_05485 [Bacteriovoracaceae bacterium]
MKSLFAMALSICSVSLFAATLELDQLSKDDVKKVGNEFSSNFSHTTVAAPETDGLWGVEVGVAGGTTSSPRLQQVVDDTGGNGSDFKTLYHAGLIGRVHVPFELFLEANILPERTFSNVTVKNRSFGLGWNAGSYFNLPLDLAIGYNFSNADMSFDQTINNSSTGNTDVDATIKVAGKSSISWIGVSKTFLFFTPYFKAGLAKTDTDVSVDASGSASIFSFSSSQSQSTSSSGGYAALGANLQFFFMRLGFEASQMIGVKSATAKLSIAF